MDYKFCEYCDDSVFILAHKLLEERLNGTDNEAMKEVLLTKSMDDIGTKGKELVEWCIDFLILRDTLDYLTFKKQKQDQIHPNKYITIWSFIYDFLKIPQNSGYDYWLLQFLEWNEFMNHGSGIRCGFWSSPEKYKDRIVSEERKQAIIKWCETCPDDV